MNTSEQAPRFEATPDFGMELGMGNFDINAAFQEAIQGVASDAELALEEKVRRMEVIISEGTSEVYRDFIDFRSMAARMDMACNHNHALNQSIQSSEAILSFMNIYKPYDEQHHDEGLHGHDHDDEVVDPKTGKKIRKKSRA